MEFRKDNMSEYCKNCYELQQQLDQLKAENKHINDLLNQALKELEKTIETLTEIKEIANYSFDLSTSELLEKEQLEKIKSLEQECEELKETLAEIKESVGIGLVDGLQPEEYSGFLKTLQAQILQKISECEVKNEN